MSKLAGSSPSVYIATWRKKVREAIASSSTEPEDGAKGRYVPKGFKVRKLFDDGKYYEGQVISGPSKAFDEEKRKTVLCWRVKYLDDDEEEFTLDELDLWGFGNEAQKGEGEELGVASLNTNASKSVGVVDGEQPRSQETVSAPNAASRGNDHSCNESTNIANDDRKLAANNSTSSVSTVNESTGNVFTGSTSENIIPENILSSRNDSSRTVRTGTPSPRKKSIGKKVQDLKFNRSNSEGGTLKPKGQQSPNDDWDSSPLIKQRGLSKNESEPNVPRSTAFMGSLTRRRNPRRSSAPDTVVNETSQKKALAATEITSSPNEAPPEASTRRRRSTRNYPPEELNSTESNGTPYRDRRKPTPPNIKKERLLPSRDDSEAPSRDTWRRRSTRGRTIVKLEQPETTSRNSTSKYPPREGRRRSSRVSREV